MATGTPGGAAMTIQTLADLLEEAATQTEAESLRNVASVVMALTEVTRYYNGKGRPRTYNGDIDAIAGAARQLADMVIMMLEDDNAVPLATRQIAQDALRKIREV